MKAIESSYNDTYKNLKKLATSTKHRRAVSQTLLDGIHLCASYLQSGGRPFEYIYTTLAVDNPEAKAIIDDCEKLGTPAVLLSEGKFRSISGVDNGVGIAFVIDIPLQQPPETLVSGALLLEDVQDPGNMGAILRTAAASGIGEIFISSASTSAWSPKVLRAGMGAHAALRVYENCDLIRLIQTADIPVLATSLGATDSIYQMDLSSPTAWLFGNEGSGVSDELMALDVQKVIIPQSQGVESLNVAASVAICLFEQVRQQESSH